MTVCIFNSNYLDLMDFSFLAGWEQDPTFFYSCDTQKGTIASFHGAYLLNINILRLTPAQIFLWTYSVIGHLLHPL